MAAQLRPTRLDVTDRFPMLGFTIRSTNPPRVAEVVLATSPALFASSEGRNPSNFYTSREHGLLSVARGEAVYVVPPEVLGRFVAADRLYFGLATATPPKGDDWTVELRPGEGSPYVSLSGLSDRALRRVRMFPARRGSGRYAVGAPAAMLDWAGDRAEPGMAPAAPQAPAAAPAAPPANVPYDDGFGPLPPLASEPPASTPAAQSYARGLEADPDQMGIEEPVLDEQAAPQAMALGGNAPVLTAADYAGVTKLMPSPNYNEGRGGQAIDRIVIHITGAPQSPHLGSWFTNPASKVSSHYMVDQNGEIIQFVREQDIAWHAKGANRTSIGIEHVAVQRGGATYGKKTYPYTPPTDVEYRTSAALVAHLCVKYGLTPDRTTIIGHREADTRTTHSACPDGAWEWDAYMALVAAEYAALAAAPATAPGGATGTGQSLGYARGLEADPDQMGIEEPVLDEQAEPQAMALGARPRALKAAEYGGVTKIMPSPAYNEGRRGRAIDRIVIHITGAGQTRYLGSWFTREAANSSAHYMVDQNGDIIQFVREQDTAWHARGANRRSIGIEHVAVQRGGATYGKTHYPYTPPSDAEYRASAVLVAHLCRKYGLSPDRTTIIGHREADTGTTHTACPDGAWDWDAYMTLVAGAYAVLAAGGAVVDAIKAVGGAVSGAIKAVGGAIGLGLEVDPETMGVDGPAYSDDGAASALAATALALGAKEYDRVSRVAISPAFTPGRSGQAINRIVIHITDAPTTRSTVNHFTRADANSSAHYLVGQDGEIVQFVSEADTAWHAKGANRTSIGIEHVAVKEGGATYGKTTYPHMPPTDIQYSESAALVCHLCDKYGLTANRTTIIGHREADSKTDHTSCPDGAWDWEHFMSLVAGRASAPQPTGQGLSATSRALSGDGDTIEIKYRAFIPSPAIKGPPFMDNYHGDGRGFSYAGGTSRGEITCLVDMSPSGAISNLRTNAHWSPTYSYSSDDTPPVPGKPDWWLGLNAGAAETGRGDCDGELRASFGAPGSTRNITAGVEQASIVSLYMSGNNPLATGSPAIDADVSIFLRRSADGGVEARAVGSHDGFPAHELYVNKKRLFGYDPVAAGNGPTALLPPTDQHVDTAWTTVAAAISSGQSYQAQGLSGGDWSVNWDEVHSIAQPTDMSCWATAAAMLIGWRERQSVSPSLLAETAGLVSSLGGGLAPEDKKAFADALDLKVHPNACYTPEGFRDVLVANGPIWVTAKVPGVHAIVVTGMYCENGNYFVRVTDPWDRIVGLPGAPGPRPTTHNTGSQYIMTYDAFTSEFEAAGDVERIQLLHTGGTHGHVVNHGSAKAAGYAQALGDDAGFGAGTSLTRQVSEEAGRRYDLAQLAGMVAPANALAGGAGAPALPGERALLTEWPYIDGPSGRTQAGIAIDWQVQGGAVGNVVIAPAGGQMLDGWTAAVRADITRAASTPERVNLSVRVTTTFSHAGEKDQVAVTDVLLGADGRAQKHYNADQAPPPPAPAVEPARQAVPA